MIDFTPPLLPPRSDASDAPMPDVDDEEGKNDANDGGTGDAAAVAASAVVAGDASAAAAAATGDDGDGDGNDNDNDGDGNNNDGDGNDNDGDGNDNDGDGNAAGGAGPDEHIPVTWRPLAHAIDFALTMVRQMRSEHYEPEPLRHPNAKDDTKECVPPVVVVVGFDFFCRSVPVSPSVSFPFYVPPSLFVRALDER